MTVNNQANKVIAAGNGVQTVFNFSFIAVDPSDLTVILTDSAGNETTLATALYTVVLTPVSPGQIWALGGNVTYPLTGSPIPTGSTLTIVRELSLTQLVALGNQGNEFPSAVETALDLIEMQLQQVFELFQRAIVAPVVDPSAPLPLPPVAQRANLGMGFDSAGNPVAIAIPASGVISSAMQPVVNAATLAAGRTAFGLRAMAQEGIGAGLQDDGSNNARVNSAFTQDATNQAVTAAFHETDRIATGTMIYTLARANTLWNGFSFKVFVAADTVSITPNAADQISGLASGATLTLAKGGWYTIGTDAAASGIWYIEQASSPATAPGTWTPVDVSPAGLVFTSVSAGYTRIGNIVFAYATWVYPASADSTNNAQVGGLPFAAANAGYGNMSAAGSSSGGAVNAVPSIAQNTQRFFFLNAANGNLLKNSNMSGQTVHVMCIYPAT